MRRGFEHTYTGGGSQRSSYDFPSLTALGTGSGGSLLELSLSGCEQATRFNCTLLGDGRDGAAHLGHQLSVTAGRGAVGGTALALSASGTYLERDTGPDDSSTGSFILTLNGTEQEALEDRARRGVTPQRASPSARR